MSVDHTGMLNTFSLHTAHAWPEWSISEFIKRLVFRTSGLTNGSSKK